MATNNHFQQAMMLAKQGQLEPARQALKQHLKDHPTDTRAWWAFANLTSNADLKRKSLERLLQLDPNHEGAQAMFAELSDAPAWMQVAAKTAPTLQSTEPPTSTPFNATPFGAESLQPVRSTEPDILSITELQKQRAVTQAQSPLHKRKDKRAIGPVAVVIITLGVFGIAILLWFLWQTFLVGPNLAERAENDYIAIRYPQNWVHVQRDDFYTTLVMTTSEIEVDRVNPWPILANQGMVQYDSAMARYSVTYWTQYFYWGRFPPEQVKATVEDLSATLYFERFKSDEYALATIQIVPLVATDADLHMAARAFGQWMATNLPEETQFRRIEVRTEVSDIDIDGRDGQFVEVYFKETSPIGVARDAIYIATVVGDEYGYLMLFSGVERNEGEWQPTALAMAESITLQQD